MGKVGIGTDTPTQALDVQGILKVSSDVPDSGHSLLNSGTIKLGNGRTSNGYAYVDLIADPTYTEYGLRLIRSNSGANAISLISHRGTGNLILNAVEAADVSIQTNNSERMTITSNGNVGIGTDTPTAPLDVNGSMRVRGVATMNNSLIVQRNQDSYPSALSATPTSNFNPNIMRIESTQSDLGLDFGIKAGEGAWLQTKRVDNTQHGRLLLNPSGGNVGIGTTNPGEKLHVTGTILSAPAGGTPAGIARGTNSTNGSYISSDGTIASQRSSTSANLHLSKDSGVTSGEFISFYRGGTRIGTISLTGSGATVAYNTTSDARLKENIVPVLDALETLGQVEVRNYNFINDSTQTKTDGFIAQQLQPIVPYAVTGDPNGDVNEAPMSVDYSKLTPLLVKAVQELKAENEALKARIIALEQQ